MMEIYRDRGRAPVSPKPHNSSDFRSEGLRIVGQDVLICVFASFRAGLTVLVSVRE